MTPDLSQVYQLTSIYIYYQMYIHNGKQAESVLYLVQKKKKINFYKYKIREIKQCIVNLLSTNFFF